MVSKYFGVMLIFCRTSRRRFVFFETPTALALRRGYILRLPLVCISTVATRAPSIGLLSRSALFAPSIPRPPFSSSVTPPVPNSRFRSRSPGSRTALSSSLPVLRHSVDSLAPQSLPLPNRKPFFTRLLSALAALPSHVRSSSSLASAHETVPNYPESLRDAFYQSTEKPREMYRGHAFF